MLSIFLQGTVVEDEKIRAREASWARGETRSRNMGNARSVGGAAVTGHAKPKPSGSLRKGVLTSGARGTVSDSAPARKPLVKTASLLAGLDDRSHRFA